MKTLKTLIFAMLLSAFCFCAYSAYAEYVVSITDKEKATKIFLTPDSVGTVFKREKLVPFLPFTSCKAKNMGEYRHNRPELKIGDTISHQGLKIEVGDITILRYNEYAGKEDAGKIQTCQISKDGFHPAAKGCELVWVNFTDCFGDKVK